ncbi:nitrate/nitrite transport system substrate-binding protein [Bosea sp. OAE752]|uniref:CmpA/NrtA family ABC transporter substrate-binding protein n=1 Tax=unclassified Bosea (in: a-proteobacteria) TaxID=2653178 RepID=UPI0011755168
MTQSSKTRIGMTALAPAGASRRRFLQLSGTAALLAAAKTALPSGAFAQGTGPEVKGTRLGYIALTDASPLIIAKEKGLFAKYGLPDMDIAKQASWGATRDNMALGFKANGIDGAHILSPKPYLYTTGKVMQNSQPLPMYTLMRLNEDCQGLSVSNEYKELPVGTDSSALKEAFAKKRAAGKEVKVAMTFPGGTHDLWIRYWLAAGGIDPDNDLATIVVPPAQMVANMKVGTMDCFCVGEPWNEQLVNQDIGFTAATTGEIWFKHPEKALGMRADFVDANPKATQAIMLATMEAQIWCEKMENKQEMAEIIGRRQWFNVPVPDIIGRIKGDINYGRGKVAKGTNLLMKFWGEGGSVSYPWKSLDTWFVTENIRWGKFEANTDIKTLVNKVNRSDLWLEAAKTLGVAGAPTSDSRGVETFFDGMKFDPAAPMDYLKALKIKRIA